jgi:two-component system OmpR family sensor kinase
LSHSEKRSLIRFLVIYLASTFVLFALASWIFYHATERNIYQQQESVLTNEAEHILTRLRELHLSDASILYYPQSRMVQSAIYDIDRHYIFGSFPKPPALDAPAPRDHLRRIVRVDPHYLGAAYLLVSRPFDETPMCALRRNILFFMLIGGVFFAILGYFLGRLFIAPMRESVEEKNRFIEDATHELNTPISTILTNIEMIEALEKGLDVREELGRIGIASRTLSRIYDDLTFLSLNHPYHRQIVEIDMGKLLRERLEYFAGMCDAKGLEVLQSIEEEVIVPIDPNDAMRLIDNLLSNAIKYNRSGGTLETELNPEYLRVRDTGIGIPPEKIATIHERFRRANASEGGFGIGLNIVHQVVEYYGFGFEIHSELDQGTEIIIRWRKK